MGLTKLTTMMKTIVSETRMFLAIAAYFSEMSVGNNAMAEVQKIVWYPHSQIVYRSFGARLIINLSRLSI